MEKLKILFLYPNEFIGPEMTVNTQIIRNLDRKRFSIDLAINAEAEGTLGLSSDDGIVIHRKKFGISLRSSRIGGLISTAYIAPSLLSLIRLARRKRIDIVHCTSTPRTASMGYLIAKATGAKLLVHYHVLPGRYAGPRQIFENYVSRHADRAVAVSEFMARMIPQTGISESKVSVVTNGVDLQKFQPGIDGAQIRAEYGIAEDEIVVLQLGRIIQQKRQEDVVRAFALARRKVPQLRCLLIGWEDPRYTGAFQSYKEELLHIAQQENLGESLIIAPARSDVAQLLAAADIFVMPSDGDSWNLTVTEAMAMGKPVIGSLSGGIPEQIVDGRTGFLVPLKSAQLLAERIVELAENADMRAMFGRSARQRAEHYFDARHVAANFAPIYERMAELQHRLK